MTRFFLTLSVVAATYAIAASNFSASEEPQARHVVVIGDEDPLFLGSAVVRASALPSV